MTSSLNHRFQDRIVFSGIYVSLLPLPGEGPPSIKCTHRISIRTDYQYLSSRLERQDTTFVLQQSNGLFRSLSGNKSMFVTSEIRIFRRTPIRTLKQIQPKLHPQDTANCIVNTFHRYFSFLYQIFQINAKAPFVRSHCHIDSCIDCQLNSLFSRTTDFIALIKIINIRPVSNNYSVPI